MSIFSEQMTTTLKPVRVALIGYGFVGKTFHAPLIRAVPGLAITVVASRHREKVLADVPEAQVVANPEEAVRHPDVDLIVIASPNETHVPLASAGLNAGKHVVVDKPFTITLAEARVLGALAEENGRLLSVFQNRRWDSEYLGAQPSWQRVVLVKFCISSHTWIAFVLRFVFDGAR